MFVSKLELGQILDTVEKALARNNMEIRQKSRCIDFIKTEFDLNLQRLENEKLNLKEELEKRGSVIMKYQAALSLKYIETEALEAQLHDLTERNFALESKVIQYGQSPPWNNQPDDDNTTEASSETSNTNRKLLRFRILKVEHTNYTREFFFQPFKNKTGSVVLKISECGRAWKNKINIDMTLIKSLIQNIEMMFDNFHEKSMLDFSVGNTRRYSLSVKNTLDRGQVLIISTGPGPASRIEIPEGVQGKFQDTLTKYLNESNVDPEIKSTLCLTPMSEVA